MSAGAMAALALLVGCGSVPGVAAPPTAPRPAVPTAPPSPFPGCLPTIPGSDAVETLRSRLAADFTAVAAVWCTVEPQRVAGQGEWLVVSERRADKGLQPLLEVLRARDDPRWNGACTMELRIEPQVWLLDAAGRGVLPAWPRDGCSKAKVDRSMLAKVPFGAAVTHRIRQLTMQEALDAGCAAEWKAMVAISAADAAHRDRAGGDSPAVPLFQRPPQAVRVCVYRLEPSLAPPGGVFQSGGVVPASRLRPLLPLLARTTDPVPCRARAASFAVLQSGPGQGPAHVELDGCRRALTEDGQLRQVDDALVTFLATIFAR